MKELTMNKLSVRRGITCTLGTLTISGLLGTGVAHATAVDRPDHGPTAPVAVNPALFYQLRTQHTDRCLDVRSALTNDGSNARQWTCVAGAGQQQWRLVDLGDGFYQIRARHSDKCLDVEAGLLFDGANVHQWTCIDGATRQQWRLAPVGGGFVEIRARHSDKCLDVEDVGVLNGADADQWTCTGATNQHWRLAYATQVGHRAPFDDVGEMEGAR
jgi:hypothetical protein